MRNGRGGGSGDRYGSKKSTVWAAAGSRRTPQPKDEARCVGEGGLS